MVCKCTELRGALAQLSRSAMISHPAGGDWVGGLVAIFFAAVDCLKSTLTSRSQRANDLRAACRTAAMLVGSTTTASCGIAAADYVENLGKRGRPPSDDQQRRRTAVRSSLSVLVRRG